jgi:radical SAM protein with 4Fe4S-binding SPASM domain
MIKLEFTTVIGCKNMCAYCPQAAIINSYKGKGNMVMTLDDFKACVDKAPGKAEIAFSGFAEPFLNPKCIDMVEYAYKKGHPVSVYTTLVGASMDDIRRLGKIRFYDFVLHLPDKAMTIKINDEYLDRLRAAVKLNISATHDRHACCFAEVDKRVMDAIGTGMKVEDMVQPNTRAGYIKKSGILRTGTITCRKCGSALNNNIIMPNGDVVLCCMDFGQKHVFGNLLRQSYGEIMRSPERKRVMDGLANENMDILCRGCESSISLTGDGIIGAILYLNSRRKELFK